MHLLLLRRQLTFTASAYKTVLVTSNSYFSPVWTQKKKKKPIMRSQWSHCSLSKAHLQRQSFNLWSGLHRRLTELYPFQLADVMQWKLWGFQLAFNNLTVGLNKKKSTSKFWFKCCLFTKYPESGDIAGMSGLNLTLNLTFYICPGNQNFCSYLGKQFSKELNV